MKNTFGNNITLTLFGESHGAVVGCVIDGLTPGLPVDDEKINYYLSQRRSDGKTGTPRIEKDEYQIVSGCFNGKTTGTPLTIVIPNENTKSKDYKYGSGRPSHADYAAYCKYHGNEDYRGGGHFSGRITAGLVAAGGILLPALENLGIKITTEILECHGAKGEDAIIAEIEKAKSECDSVGGIVQTVISGMPTGVGEPWFDSVEGLLSHAIFSIGGIKGIEFGSGFDCTNMKGSEFNDPIVKKDGKIVTETNHNGGINGGITNGMDIVFQCAVKPTPSISQPQRTVNFVTGEEETLVIEGRHDPAIIRRIRPVISSVCALVVADLLVGRFGTDALLEKIPHGNV